MFEWLDRFHQSQEKPQDYAEKALAAYRLGMKAGGSIRGVSIQTGEECCAAARSLPAGAVYDPDRAPRLPLAECSSRSIGSACRCVYRPVMSYQAGETLEDAG